MPYYFRRQSKSQSAEESRTKKQQFLLEQIFSNQWIQELLQDSGLQWRERVFSPLVTMWVFINQILSQDHSCRSAVSSLVSLRSFLRLPRLSLDTGAYCRARKRLSLAFIKNCAQGASQRLLENFPMDELWKGFEVLLVDGSEASLPDTKANRVIYEPARKFGLLKARVLGVFSQSSGALVEFKMGPWFGKGSGEVSMLRSLLGSFKSSHLVVMDRLFGSYIDMALLMNHQVHFVVRTHASFKRHRGKRLGKNDWLLELKRPLAGSCHAIAREFLPALSPTIMVREVLIRFKRRGFRVKHVYLMTSLLDPKEYRVTEIAELYGWRWNAETDLRSLKIGLNMDVLRCKTPEMVEKEAWMHVLTYNMIRVVMAEAGALHRVKVRQLSFQECAQLFGSFRLLCCIVSPRRWLDLYEDLLRSFTARVGNRPGRYEPRLVKHNKQKYNPIKSSRKEARKAYCKKGWAYQKRKNNAA